MDTHLQQGIHQVSVTYHRGWVGEHGHRPALKQRKIAIHLLCACEDLCAGYGSYEQDDQNDDGRFFHMGSLAVRGLEFDTI